MSAKSHPDASRLARASRMVPRAVPSEPMFVPDDDLTDREREFIRYLVRQEIAKWRR